MVILHLVIMTGEIQLAVLDVCLSSHMCDLSSGISCSLNLLEEFLKCLGKIFEFYLQLRVGTLVSAHSSSHKITSI